MYFISQKDILWEQKIKHLDLWRHDIYERLWVYRELYVHIKLSMNVKITRTYGLKYCQKKKKN